jgi:hypothetical protein
MVSVESAGGRLGAVLAAPRSGVVPLGLHGPWLTTTLSQARRVLTDPQYFDFPGDVSRTGDLSASRGETRSGHVVFAPLPPDQVVRGTETFQGEWALELARHDRATPGEPYDAMVLLRRPVARSTCAAVLPTSVTTDRRDAVADAVLVWIDALAPVIAAARPPHRWSRARRHEERTRRDLEDLLAEVDGLPMPPGRAAVLLAAGIQVPIAAGAWLLAWLAAHDGPAPDPAHAAWEAVRLTPPTWLTARVTTADVEIDGHPVPAGAVVLVSPLLLGRLPSLVPGDDLGRFDPDRWGEGTRRPGAWLPFGAGPHACPGRHLGMAVLVALATWAADRTLALAADVDIDQSRGIAPLPCRFTTGRREPTR